MFDSDGLNSELTFDILRGGYVTPEVRAASTPGNSELHRGFFSLKNNLSFAVPFKKLFKNRPLRILGKVGQESYFSAQYNRNHHELFFLGNANYVGQDQIDISDFNFTQYSFRKIGLGVYNANSKSHYSINLYLNNAYRNYEIDNGTHQVDFNDLSLIMNATLIDNSYDHDDPLQSVGFGVDVHHVMDVGKKDSYIIFNAERLGVLQLNSKQNKILVDSAYQFSGIDLNELILDGADETITAFDDINTLERSPADTWVFLPVEVGANYFTAISENLTGQVGLRTYYLADWRPEITLGANYTKWQDSMIGLSVKYGGFGNFNYGLNGSKKIDNQFVVGARLNYLDGLINRQGYGAQAGVFVIFHPVK